MDAFGEQLLKMSQGSVDRVLESVQRTIDEHPELGELPVDVDASQRFLDEFIRLPSS
jgi:hypothetical protein